MSLYGYRWQQTRLRFLALRPLCEMCGQRGIVAPSTIVDHRIAHKQNLELFWQESNWAALCKPCHDSRKSMLERGDKVLPHASWNVGGGQADKLIDVRLDRHGSIEGNTPHDKKAIYGN